MCDEKKFGNENWRIIEDLKEESRQLKQFEASILSEQDNNDSNSQFNTFSPSQYMCESAVEETIKNTPVEKVGRAIDVDNYIQCTSNLFEDVPLDEPLFKSLSLDEPLFKSLSTINYQVQDETASGMGSTRLQDSSPSPLSAVLQCLINIPKFDVFIAGISEKFQDKQYKERYPTIMFLNNALKCLQEDNNSNLEGLQVMLHAKDYQPIHDEVDIEPVPTILMSMIELLHEELIEAKSSRVLTHTCMDDCRLSTKCNHSLVSHLFHGHLQRKIMCCCGYDQVTNKPFTDISIPLDNIQQKSLMLNYIGECRNGIVGTTRFLFAVNQWTSVKTLVEKLCIVLTKQVNDFIGEAGLVMYLTVNGESPRSLKSSKRIVELMGEDGQLCVYDTSLGDLALNFNSLLSSNTTVGELSSVGDHSNNNTQRVYNTPQWGDDIGGSSCTGRCEKKRMLRMVFVKVVQPSLQVSFDMVLRFPKISNGLHILERLCRVLNITRFQLPSLILRAKNKNGKCVSCLDECCLGCPIHDGDKILLSRHYTIELVVHCLSEGTVSVQDDASVLTNKPINILSMDESLSAYSESCETEVCPTCLEKNWLPSETVLIKCPIIMIIHFPILLGTDHWFAYPVEKFRPFLRKRQSNTEYSLLSIVKNDEDHSVLFNRSVSQLTSLFMSTKVSPCSPSQSIELLLFEKVKNLSTEKLGIQGKISRRLRNKQNKSLLTTKFSPSSGESNKRKAHSSAGVDLPGYYSMCMNTMTSGSVCNCTRCHTITSMHSQMLSSRSSLVTSKDVSRVESLTSQHRCSTVVAVPSEANAVLPEHNLHKAVREQDFKGAVHWLENGADVNAIYKGIGALHLSVGMAPPFGDVFTQLCLKHGADANLASRDGVTPIHMSVMSGRDDTLELLIKAGGVATIKDTQGRNAFDILLQENPTNSERLLRLLRGEVSRPLHDDSGNSAQITPGDLDVSMLHISDMGLSTNRAIETHTLDVADDELIQPTESNLRTHPDIHIASFLHESPVSHPFSPNSENSTFRGSAKTTWISLSSCAGKFSKVRRRRNEERWITRVVRHRIATWVETLFRR